MEKFRNFITNPFTLVTIALIASYVLCIFLFEKDNLFYIKFLATSTLSNGLLTNISKSIFDRETQKEMLLLNRKVQDEMIKLTKKLDASNIVHKVQFEKEFNIYVELFDELNSFFALIVSGHALSNKEYTDIKNEIIKVIDKNYPFYSEKIYTLIKKDLFELFDKYKNFTNDKTTIKDNLDTKMNEIAMEMKKIIRDYKVI